MKAVQVVGYHTKLQLTDIPEPTIEGPLDVIVRIGGAGVCRTDLHILEGQWEAKSGVALPYTIGHENAGWVHAVGDAVTNVAVGDKVILHPLITCGLCRACRFGDDVHCQNSKFPGIDVNGGYAEYLRTTARSVVRIDGRACWWTRTARHTARAGRLRFRARCAWPVPAAWRRCCAAARRAAAGRTRTARRTAWCRP